jgi:hypothetical protein
MLHLPYPAVNVLTKIDNLKAVGGADLPFNLDYYTEVQDLHYLLPHLSAEQTASSPESEEKWSKLNEALIDLITDFGMIGFETLAVEDRQSMSILLRAIDRASGYVFAGARATDESGRTLNDEASIWAQAMSENYGKLDVRDIQERWIERKDEFDELERKDWEEEARLAGALPEKSAAGVTRRNDPAPDATMKDADDDAHDDDEDDELLAAHREWEAKKVSGDEQSTKVVRKA